MVFKHISSLFSIEFDSIVRRNLDFQEAEVRHSASRHMTT